MCNYCQKVFNKKCNKKDFFSYELKIKKMGMIIKANDEIIQSKEKEKEKDFLKDIYKNMFLKHYKGKTRFMENNKKRY